MRIVTFAGSTRSGSLNATLARVAAERLEGFGVDAEFLDLSDYPMPMYDGDLEREQGIPDTTHSLASKIQEADAIVIASPEYNGAITPLLKNTIDWITRIDKTILANRPILLAAATPGKTGGVNGMKVLRLMFDHMGLDTLDRQISVPNARDVIADGAIDDEDTLSEIDDRLTELIGRSDEHAQAA